jgi:hypothetical protein
MHHGPAVSSTLGIIHIYFIVYVYVFGMVLYIISNVYMINMIQTIEYAEPILAKIVPFYVKRFWPCSDMNIV